jgi:hypothetical protein
MGKRPLVLLLALFGCSQGGDGASGKSKPPTTAQELATALVATLNAHDVSTAQALLPTTDELAKWVTCDPSNEWVREGHAEVTRELASVASKDHADAPCKSGKCKVTRVEPQSGDEPRVMRKDETLNGCRWSTEVTMAADHMITFGDDSAPTTWRIELWLVGGRAYLMDIDG